MTLTFARKFSKLVLCTAVAIVALVSEGRSQPGPSEPAAGSNDKLVGFIAQQQVDLRMPFVGFEKLREREQKGVCLVQVEGIKGFTTMVAATQSSTLRDILGAIGRSDWKGLQQLRLIKRDLIVQSSVGPKSSPEHRETFLSSPVAPGDIVIVCKPVW